MRDIEEVDLSQVQPADYLRKGFYDAKGELRPEINGFDSLAMAYHFRKDGLTAKELQSIVDSFEEIAGQHADELSADPDLALPAQVASAIRKIGDSDTARRTPGLGALFQAAMPVVNKWKDFAALVLHLHRIAGQLALVTVPGASAEGTGPATGANR